MLGQQPGAVDEGPARAAEILEAQALARDVFSSAVVLPGILTLAGA